MDVFEDDCKVVEAGLGDIDLQLLTIATEGPAGAADLAIVEQAYCGTRQPHTPNTPEPTHTYRHRHTHRSSLPEDRAMDVLGEDCKVHEAGLGDIGLLETAKGEGGGKT